MVNSAEIEKVKGTVMLQNPSPTAAASLISMDEKCFLLVVKPIDAGPLTLVIPILSVLFTATHLLNITLSTWLAAEGVTT